MELFKICPPPQDCKAGSLYLRARSGVPKFTEGICILSPGSEVSTDTYFNIFSSSKYSKYTCVRRVSVTTLVSGKLDVELRSVSVSGEKTIESRTIDSKNSEEVTFSFDINGLNDDEPVCHYILYRSVGGSVIESFGSYISDTDPDPVSLGITICTYRREDRVLKNIDTIKRMISDEKYGVSDDITVYVVDNGRTLDEKSVNNGFVKLIPNHNSGGSGGFTRGMMECRRENKSHILLMDDDVEIDPNVIYKTFKFVSVLNDRYRDAFVLGGMLLPEDPCVQYEAGARYIGGFECGKHMLDMSDVNNLLLNEKWESADYGGWWYMCMPADAADELPLPLFIKMDDVEFGIRRMNNHVVMNGIGIWHDSFESKVSPVVDDYFLRRNTLITKALHETKNGPSMGFDYLRTAFSFIKKKEFDEPFYIQRAVKDFMAGPDFIKNTNQAVLLHNLGSDVSRSSSDKRDAVIKLSEKGLFGKLVSVFLQGFCLSLKWKRLVREYRREAKYLSSYDFWKGIY
jgi:galactofuranosylgalactofuranosylrhamnosyl-N-acetylglucosaminyl-diphospho-decaprenol beta-1,5/1,6-galactofuranosyltransferase